MVGIWRCDTAGAYPNVKTQLTDNFDCVVIPIVRLRFVERDVLLVRHILRLCLTDKSSHNWYFKNLGQLTTLGGSQSYFASSLVTLVTKWACSFRGLGQLVVPLANTTFAYNPLRKNSCWNNTSAQRNRSVRPHQCLEAARHVHPHETSHCCLPIDQIRIKMEIQESSICPSHVQSRDSARRCCAWWLWAMNRHL